MTEATPLDTAHARMEANPDADSARLGFYDVLAACELFLLLEAEADGDQIIPQTFEVADGTFVLAFDREDRLSRFAGGPAPYAALSGRTVASMLAGQGIGLAVNVEVAPSAILIPTEAVDWLADTLGQGPEAVEDHIAEFLPPAGLPEAFLTALDARLAMAAGLARSAYLVAVEYTQGGRGHLLGIIDPAPGAEAALAQAVNEALTFSGIEAGTLDVAFFAAADVSSARLARAGLRFDLPEPPEAPVQQRAAPGSDPDKPPILK